MLPIILQTYATELKRHWVSRQNAGCFGPVQSCESWHYILPITNIQYLFFILHYHCLVSSLLRPIPSHPKNSFLWQGQYLLTLLLWGQALTWISCGCSSSYKDVHLQNLWMFFQVCWKYLKVLITAFQHCSWGIHPQRVRRFAHSRKCMRERESRKLDSSSLGCEFCTFCCLCRQPRTLVS